MNTAFAAFFDLPRDQRIRLVEDLWDTIAESADDQPLEDWKRQELTARWERYQAHPDEVFTWEQVKQHAREGRDA